MEGGFLIRWDSLMRCVESTELWDLSGFLCVGVPFSGHKASVGVALPAEDILAFTIARLSWRIR